MNCTWVALSALALGAAAVACAGGDREAVVEVRWTLGGTTCARAGVTRVSVALVADGVAVSTAEAACDDGQAAVGGVAKGRYTAQVFAFRGGADTPAYSGQEAGIDVPKGGRVTSPLIFLQEAPGALDLHWRFESGRLCRFEGAGTVQVSVYDERNRLVADLGFACDPDLATGAVPAVAGTEYLEGATGVVIENLFTGSHEIVIRAYTADTDVLPGWVGTATVDVASFRLSAAEVVLAPCAADTADLCR